MQKELMLHVYMCNKGCCTVKYKQYRNVKRRRPYPQTNERRRKGGAFMYDPKEYRVLLVQSCGSLWGVPKGSAEEGETFRECAIREVMEESGQDISNCKFEKFCCIRGRAMYYYLEYNTVEVTVQNNKDRKANDANAITWIKVDCLAEFIRSGAITLNKQSSMMFNTFLGRTFTSEGEFITVKDKRTRSSS